MGGPLWTDKAWFFLAYNNNLTHRAISGVDPNEIQEEAILRNYYTKVNMALSEKDELIGYSQWGLKYRPNLPPRARARGRIRIGVATSSRRSRAGPKTQSLLCASAAVSLAKVLSCRSGNLPSTGLR